MHIPLNCACIDSIGLDSKVAHLKISPLEKYESGQGMESKYQEADSNSLSVSKLRSSKRKGSPEWRALYRYDDQFGFVLDRGANQNGQTLLRKPPDFFSSGLPCLAFSSSR